MIINVKGDKLVESAPAFIPAGSSNIPVTVFAPRFAGSICILWVRGPNAKNYESIYLASKFGRASGIWAGTLPSGSATIGGTGYYQLQFTDASGTVSSSLVGSYKVQLGIIPTFPETAEDLGDTSLSTLHKSLAQMTSYLNELVDWRPTVEEEIKALADWKPDIEEEIKNLGNAIIDFAGTFNLILDWKSDAQEEILSHGKDIDILDWKVRRLQNWKADATELLEKLNTSTTNNVLEIAYLRDKVSKMDSELAKLVGCVFAEEENRNRLATVLETVPIVAESEEEASQINEKRSALVDELSTTHMRIQMTLDLPLEDGRYQVYTGVGSPYTTYGDLRDKIMVIAEYLRNDVVVRTETVSDFEIVDDFLDIEDMGVLTVDYGGKSATASLSLVQDTVESLRVYADGVEVTNSAISLVSGTAFEDLFESGKISLVAHWNIIGDVTLNKTDYTRVSVLMFNQGQNVWEMIDDVPQGLRSCKLRYFYNVGGIITQDIIISGAVLPSGMSVVPDTIAIRAGGTEQLSIAVTPSGAQVPYVDWFSSNENIATVDGSGLVTAKESGECYIYAMSWPEEGTTTMVAYCSVTVRESLTPVTGVSLDQSSLSMDIYGDSFLTATIEPTGADNTKLIWSVSPGNVVVLTYPVAGYPLSANINAISAGTAVVTVQTDDGGYKASCTINVNEAAQVPVESVTLSASEKTLNIGERFELTPTLTPSNATNQVIGWKSSAVEVAEISGGTPTLDSGVVATVGSESIEIIAKAEGNATITATTSDGNHMATCLITVGDSPILLTAEYDDSTPVSKDTPLGDLAVVVKAGYESGKWSDALEHSKDYAMAVTAPTAGSLLSGVTNTVTVTGLGIYAGLTTTFYVTAKSEEPVDPEEPTLLALQEDDGETTVQIGEENASKLNDALKAVGAGGTVKLKTGNYPLTPGVVTVGWDGQAEVDNVTLELNGSVLTSTLRKYEKTGLIMLRGKNPTIRGGDSVPVVTDNESAGEGENNLTVTGGGLCGLFDTPDDLNDSKRDFEIDIDGNQAAETGKEYKYWEKESLVGLVPFGYTNATIENLDLHNCWGYGVCERGKGYYNRTLITLADANITVKDEGEPGYYFTSDLISATGAKITDNDTLTSYNKMCVGVAGYFRIVSDENVKYTFTLDNYKTTEISAPPQTMIDIPSNATNVTIKLTFNCAVDDERTELLKRLDYTDTEGVVHRHMVTVFYSREHTGGLNVKGCKMHHNGSLGMVGGSTGETVVENCESWRQGTPYDIPTQEDITERGQTGETVATKGNTIGLIDIEDSPSPSVKMDGCKTRDETLLAMLGAYKAEVSRCSGGTIVIYRGWSANISDSAVDAGVFGNSQTSTSSVTTPVTLTNCSAVGSTLVAYPANVTGTGCTIYNRRVDLMPGFATGGNTFVYDDTNSGCGSVSGLVNLTIQEKNKSIMHNAGETFATSDGSDVTLKLNDAMAEGAFNNIPGCRGGDCYGVTCDDTFVCRGYTLYGSDSHPSTLKPGSIIHYTTPSAISGTYENCTIDTSERCLFYPTSHGYGVEVVFKNCKIKNSENYIFGLYDNGTTYGKYGWGGLKDSTVSPLSVFKFIGCTFYSDNYEDMICATRNNSVAITAGVPEVSFTNCKVEKNQT